MWCEIGSWPSVVADAVQQTLRGALPSRKLHVSQAALMVGVALTVAACSSIDSMFGDEPPPPTARTTGAAAPAQSGTSADKRDTPKLSTVPARPERPTPPPQQGLAADRSSARYADNEVRPVNEAADAVVGQRLGASTPSRPAGQGAAVQPAAAPVTPVQSAPSTPVQPAPVQQAPQSGVQQAPVAPAAQAPMQAPMPAPVPVASTLPPPPPPSQQALILPPTTRPSVSAVTGRAPATTPTPIAYGNNIQVAVVQFGRASSGLSSDDLAVLRDVAEIQKKQGGTVRIVGHASQDSSGSDVQRLQQGNYTVSLARANSIANQLVRFGVPRGSVLVEAAGDQQPEYDPVTAVAVASNRRAEIYLAF